MEVRAAVGRISAGKSYDKDEVKALGGPEKAAAKCALYVRLPERMATRECKNHAFEILNACGQPAVPWLVSLLGSSDAYVRWHVARGLGWLGDPRTVEPLLAALKDSDSGVRRKAADALGELKNRRAVASLTGALQDPDSKVRWAALVSLGKLKVPRAVEPLADALSDPARSALQRYDAVDALGESEDPRAVEPLIKALKDPDAFVRFKAAQALANLKDPRAIEPLKSLSADRDESIRTAAAEALKKIRGEEAGSDGAGAITSHLKKGMTFRQVREALGEPQPTGEARFTATYPIRNAGAELEGTIIIEFDDAGADGDINRFTVTAWRVVSAKQGAPERER
jgi:HEAT repeat protein